MLPECILQSAAGASRGLSIYTLHIGATLSASQTFQNNQEKKWKNAGESAL